ncbi:MAG: MalY/PatB family protein [Salaquimonas sp.]
MKFDFDKVIDRRNTHSSKWDAMGIATGATSHDAIAMWVADMDFEAPPAVREALQEEVDRLTLGYYANDITWREAMSEWLDRHHGYKPDPAWITPTSGIGSALGLILQAFSDEGDAVIVFSPAYHAFYKYIKANNRELVTQSMEQVDGQYRMDLDALQKSLPKNAKVVFFCSPHNPGGRVWDKQEILDLVAFCEKNDLILVSDEIHNDLVFPGATHHVTHKIAPEAGDRIVTCVGATKTFNLAGAHIGGAIISDAKMRKRFVDICQRSGLLSFPLMGMIATEAAQRHGDEWLAELLPYLQTNRDLLAERIKKAIPGARPMHLQSTYLGWVNFTDTPIPYDEVMKRITKDARVGASNGPQFGPGGENWVRFNFATPRTIVDEAMNRIDEAFNDIA